MADSKISDLPAVVTPADTDEFAVNQSGTSKKITLGQIKTEAAGAGGSASFNLIDNGNFNIWQRDTIASYDALGGAYQYFADRWKVFGTAQYDPFVIEVSQETTIVPDSKSLNSLKLTPTTAKAQPTEGYTTVTQFVPGFHMLGSGFGAAGASDLVLSFKVRSSVTGTYSLTCLNGDFDLQYTTEFTINDADTWESKEIVISAATSGTWYKDYQQGIGIIICLTNGSTVGIATAGLDAWSAFTGVIGSENQVHWGGSTDDTFYLSQVQLEIGSTASDFAEVPHAEERARCELFYRASYEDENSGGTGTTVGNHEFSAPVTNALDHRQSIQFGTKMNDTPFVVIYNPTTGATDSFRNITAAADVPAAVYRESTTGFVAYCSPAYAATVNDKIAFQWTASADY